MQLPLPCQCVALSEPNQTRRKIIQIAAASLAGPAALRVSLANTGLRAGDQLVEEDAEGAPAPLKLTDLKPGKPMLAYPFDAKAGKARDDTRLNKLVLMRFDEAELDAPSRGRAAGGVLAFSAVCTHQACDVKTWLSKEKALVCYCHASKFLLLEGAAVATGPAPRPLPNLPLKLEGELLVIAGAFSAAPGGAPA